MKEKKDILEIQCKIYIIARDILGTNHSITKKNAKSLLECICNDIGVTEFFEIIENLYL